MMAVKLLLYACSYCLIIDKQELAAVCLALLAMELTLKNGLLPPQSPFAFTIYSVAEASLENIDRAYPFGRLSLDMLNSMTTSSQEATCPTTGFTKTVVICVKEPMLSLIQPLFQTGGTGCRHAHQGSTRSFIFRPA
jgi:hypothetical protein